MAMGWLLRACHNKLVEFSAKMEPPFLCSLLIERERVKDLLESQ